MKTAQEYQAEAWLAIVAVLDEVSPGWTFMMEGSCGTERACAAIRKLAQGSASSEGAEAVAPVAWMTPGNNFLLSDHAKRHGVPPAYGMKPSDASIPLYKRWCANMAEHESKAGDPDATILPAQGEHEQRSCEGSERRPIADEVCELCGNAECFCHNSPAVDDAVVERAARAICAENGWNPDEPVTYSGTRRKVKNKDGSCVLQWMLHTGNARAALESAIPRGLPPGSVKREDVEAFLVKYHAQVWEAAESGGEYDYAGRELAKQFLARFDATAEQPSCGQDARDAAVTDLEALQREMRDHRIAIGHVSLTVLAWADRLSRVIAAQQRQGGTP